MTGEGSDSDENASAHPQAPVYHIEVRAIDQRRSMHFRAVAQNGRLR